MADNLSKLNCSLDQKLILNGIDAAVSESPNMVEACRTCLRLINVDTLPFYEIEADVVQLSTESCRYKLSNIIPEIALNIPSKSMICTKCHENVEALFEFKAKCLKTEYIIMQYLKAKPDVDIEKFDLKDVLAINGGDTENTEAVEASIEHVTVKEELESSDVAEEFVSVSESIVVVKQEVENYLPESVVNTVLQSNKELEEGRFKCTSCSMSFKTSYRLKKHLHIHRGDTYKCNVCDKGFNRINSLIHHQKVHKQSLECDICKKKFARRVLLNLHRRTVHKISRKNICQYCNKQCVDLKSLNIHMRSHSNEKPFCCSICDQQFKLQVSLKIHLRRHNGKRSYVCTVCDKAFYTKNVLREHMRTHSDEQPFKCELCQKSYRWLSSLELHKKGHLGIKRFGCEKCDKVFVQKISLIKHMRTHSEVRSFPCPVCAEKFYKKTDVKRHVRKLHTDVDYSTIVFEPIYTNIVDGIKTETQEIPPT